MARIAGNDIPENKRVEVSLTYIFGIGRKTSNKILDAVNINKDTRVKDLAVEQLNQIRSEIEKYTVEGDLRRNISFDIKRIMDLGNYTGMRHRRRLPVRGQRTKTNARTRKGSKKQIISK